MLSPEQQPVISCVICTVDRPDTIARAVASVLRGNVTDLELIVIDQSTDDRTRTACRQFENDARFHFINTPQRGLSRAYNRGITETTAPVIAFTDDDCIAHADWLESIERIFREETDVDMIYGQTLLPADGADQHSIIPALAFEEVRRIDKTTGPEIIGMGANFALRRSMVESIGPFDEALGGGGPLRSSQDYDLQFRAFRAGHVIRLSPEVNVDHYGARTIGTQWNKTLEAYGFGDGAFYSKHIRCRDFSALRLAAAHITKLVIREAMNPVRRKSSKWPYIRSFVQGMKAGTQYPIDRTKRLYVLGSEGV